MPGSQPATPQSVSVVELAESVEAEFMYQYESMAPDAVKSQLGISTTRIGGVAVLSMRNDVTGYWSKAVGFGASEPVTSALIDEVLDFYRAESSPGAVIQISPPALPRDWDQLAAKRYFCAQDPWYKLVCRVEDFGAAFRTDLRVGPVAKIDAREWAAVALRGFGMPARAAVGWSPRQAWHTTDQIPR